MELLLCCPDYSLVSKRAKSVNISIKAPTRGEISHLVIDSTVLKVFGEGEGKVRRLISAGCGASFIWPQTVQRTGLSVLIAQRYDRCTGTAGVD